MTEITSSEIRVIVIQILIMTIIGTFMHLYSQATLATTQIPTSTSAQNNTVSATSQSWISSLLSIPSGMGTLTYIALLIIAPFAVFDAIIIIRFAKDIATKWI